jgi:hypothetical protein
VLVSSSRYVLLYKRTIKILIFGQLVIPNIRHIFQKEANDFFLPFLTLYFAFHGDAVLGYNLSHSIPM